MVQENQEVASISYNNLTINKSAGLAEIIDTVNIAGNLLISSGELDNSSVATVTGNVSIATGTTLENTNTLYIGGNWDNNGTFTGLGTKIVFNGSGTQSIFSDYL